jgi:hypothetical protein
MDIVAHEGRGDHLRFIKGNQDGLLKDGRQEVETVWIVTSLTAEQAHSERLLALARQYRSLEDGTHSPHGDVGQPRRYQRRAAANLDAEGQRV